MGDLTLDYTCSKDAIHLCLLFLRIVAFGIMVTTRLCATFASTCKPHPDVMEWADIYI